MDTNDDKPPSDSEEGNSESDDDDTTDSEDSSEYSDLLEEEESSEESFSDFQEEDGDSAGESHSDANPDESSSDEEGSKEEPDKSLSESPVSHAKSTDPKDVSSTITVDEYEHDTSDEEDIRNTVGNIPMEWYREYPHIGYDVDGNRLIKPKQGDELDNFLRKADDPNYWRTITHKMTGQNVILTDDDVKLIQRLQQKKAPAGESLYEPWIDFFTHEKMIHPVSSRPEHKRSFVPSKWEKLKVGQMVHALKMGWMKPTATKKDEDEEIEDEQKFFMIWKDDDEDDITKRYKSHIAAPKMRLPGHEESYNPPPEYLFNEEEKQKWKEQDPEDRRINFIPSSFPNLRSVPGYRRFINERFERCLDLYLCPRQRKMKMNVNPQDLLPKLPKPKDLQPFPTTLAVIYKGHTDIIRSISACPSGQWISSGSDDQTVRFWEVSTGRCMKTLEMNGKVTCIEWNPNPAISLVAATIGTDVVLINPGLADKLICSNTDEILQSYTSEGDQNEKARKLNIDWEICSGANYAAGLRIKIHHPKDVSRVSWHVKGDYFATAQPKGQSASVVIHQLSKRRSQNPFSKSKGLVQCVLFHPVRPFLFVATQRYVRVYNLLKQELTKKLMTNCKWVSSMAVHRGGDNVIIGSYDSRLSWFDLDLSTKPYQTLRHHKRALRQVCFHKKYPLFASASDDGTVIICHGMVYSDLMQNPLIVPVKVLRGHAVTKSLGVLDCVFHPSQPWIFSSGADETIRLYT